MLLQSEFEGVFLSATRFKNAHMPLSVRHQPKMIIWRGTAPEAGRAEILQKNTKHTSIPPGLLVIFHPASNSVRSRGIIE